MKNKFVCLQWSFVMPVLLASVVCGLAMSFLFSAPWWFHMTTIFVIAWIFSLAWDLLRNYVFS